MKRFKSFRNLSLLAIMLMADPFLVSLSPTLSRGRGGSLSPTLYSLSPTLSRGRGRSLPSGQLPVKSGAIGECKRRRPEGFGRGLHEAFGKGEYACTDAAFQGKTLPKDFGREQGAMVCYVVVEHLLQGSSRGGVEDEGVHFVVEAEGTCIEVCGADGTELTVYHHYLAVMEAVVVVPDFRSALHQLTHLQSDDIVVGHAVALG